MAVSSAVQDNINVSLSEMKTWLRILDVRVASVPQDVAGGSTTIPLDSLLGLKRNLYLTIEDVSYQIDLIDYNAQTVTLKDPLEHPVSLDTPVWAHPHDALLISLIQSVKSEADQYLNNPFTNGVPPEVKTWVMKRVAQQYDQPEAGISRVSVDDSGSKTYGDDVYSDINHLRLTPL